MIIMIFGFYSDFFALFTFSNQILTHLHFMIFSNKILILAKYNAYQKQTQMSSIKSHSLGDNNINGFKDPYPQAKLL